jgi:hypothetical protein
VGGLLQITQVNGNNFSSLQILSFGVIFAAIIFDIYFSFIHSPFQVGLIDVCDMYYTINIDNFVCVQWLC